MFNRDCKYIIYDDGMADVAILFPNHVGHASVAMSMGCTPISAGFVRMEGQPGEVCCHGYSQSLRGLPSRPEEDALIIKRMLQLP